MTRRQQPPSDEELIDLTAAYSDRRTYTAKDDGSAPEQVPDLPSGTAMSADAPDREVAGGEGG